MKYFLKNVYGIPGSSHHTVRAALVARDAREGEGWTVEVATAYDNHTKRIRND